MAAWVRIYALQSAGMTTRVSTGGDVAVKRLVWASEHHWKAGLCLATMPAAHDFAPPATFSHHQLFVHGLLITLG